jgi:hypothetical protein
MFSAMGYIVSCDTDLFVVPEKAWGCLVSHQEIGL